MPTVTIRLNNLPECCRQCLERCPEFVLRAELWRQTTWQLSHYATQPARYLAEYQMESQSAVLKESSSEKPGPIRETVMHRARGVRRLSKPWSGFGRRRVR